MQSQFKEITFKSETEFNEWLEKTTHKKIFFKDKGQDLMKLWVSESGEILHANSNFSGFEMGLTKREYFTAKAMQGLLSNPEWMKKFKGEKYLMQSDIVAEVAIKTADTILAKLSIEGCQ